MPLFIDLHIDNNLTPDLIKECHVADKAIQDKYGVRYLQILLNQPQGYLFCLVDAPDKESCAKVHQEAHGNIACNVLEITQSDFSSLLANKQKDGLDFTLNRDGTLDTGNRAVLVVSCLGSPKHYSDANEIVNTAILNNGGKVSEDIEGKMVVIFDSCLTAVDAGISVVNSTLESLLPIETRIGINYGPPLEENGALFENARRSAEHLSFISMSGWVTISSKVMQHCGRNIKSRQPVKIINLNDETFLNRVMNCTERVWDESEMTMTHFAHELGLSKSQLARKLEALSNMSPNNFLKEFRLRRSVSLLGEQNLNIAEISMAVGFTNPSYFSKCFQKRFGLSPSSYVPTAQSHN